MSSPSGSAIHTVLVPAGYFRMSETHGLIDALPGNTSKQAT
jgi:hypothetical protein